MKAVLFDLDGTLIDSSEGIIKSAQYALTHFGIEETDMQNLMSFIGPPLMYSFKNRYGFSEEKTREAVGVYRQRYNRIGIFECSLYPGVRECIEQLKKMGYLIGMASSKPEESCRRILEHFDLINLFDDVVGSTPDGKIDTKEQVLSEVMRRWHEIPTTEMCLIGDTIFDVEGANEKEIPCICVSYGFGDVEEMLAAGALKICDSMSELPQAIADL
jgi:phosphoglycolate phosphatase